MSEQRGPDGARPNDPRAIDPKAHPDDAGAYIGHEPERVAETIPGGIDPAKDERFSDSDSRSSGAGALERRSQETSAVGHRDGLEATDDVAREAGQNR